MTTASTTDVPEEVNDMKSTELTNDESSIAFGVREEIVLGMSSRADSVKEYLEQKTEVTAILLKADGTSEEIKSSASSEHIRTLLCGKATVIGEIEDLQILVLRSIALDDTPKIENKHQLPVPLCYGTYSGDILLYRMDSNGNPVDLSLKEYTKYADDHKALTQTALKSYNTDTLQIKSHSPFGSEAKYIRTQMMGEIESKLRSMKPDSVDTESKETTDDLWSDTEISKAVARAIQDSIDRTVSGWTSSPMEDPDYKPEMEEFVRTDTIDSTVSVVTDDEESQQEQEQEPDDRSWREQLNDALNHVREIGKLDGQVFAQKVSNTFYELNGEEPSQGQMRAVFSKIKNEFAYEAQQDFTDETNEDIDDNADDDDHVVEDEQDEEEQPLEDIVEEESGDDDDEDIEFEEDFKDDVVMEDMSPLDTLKFAKEAIATDWVSRAESLWQSQKNRDPTEQELAETVKQLAQDFADTVLNTTTNTTVTTQMEQEEDDADDEVDDESDGEMESDIDVNGEGDDDEDYDPENEDDIEMGEIDATENAKYDELYFDDLMLTTEVVTAQSGRGVSWNMYFDESELNEDAANSNLVKTVEGFKSMNGREPTCLELNRMKLFLSVPSEVCDEMEDDAVNVITSQMVQSTKGKAASWNVYFDHEELSASKVTQNLKNAVHAFQARNGRRPNSSERERIQQFVSVPQPVNDDGDDKLSRSSSKVLVTSVRTKKNSAKRFNLYLEDRRYSQKESEILAVRCFKKFNKREPTEEELNKIRDFVKTDATLKEQIYLVSSGKSGCGVVLDDEKETEIAIQSATKRVVTKKTATGYLLDFEQDTERDHGDEKMATKWFQRFNHREPNEEELVQIKQFVQVKDEQEDMVDID